MNSRTIKPYIFTGTVLALILTLFMFVLMTSCAPESGGNEGTGSDTQDATSAVPDTTTVPPAVPGTTTAPETIPAPPEPVTTEAEIAEPETTVPETTKPEETLPPDIPANGIVDFSDTYYPYGELVNDIEELSATYEDIFTYSVIGKSHEGRDIYQFTIGNPDAESRVILSAAIHGREYLSALVIMKQAEYYLSHYNTGTYNGTFFSDILDSCCVSIVPMTNPDGVMLCEDGISSLVTDSAKERVNQIYGEWKDIFNRDIDTFIAENWKSDAMGVDLNRNYPIDAWATNKTGIIAPCYKNYKGASAGSEDETRVMTDYISSLSGVKSVICLHTAGHVVYWDCGQTGRVRTESYELARLVNSVTQAAGYDKGYKIIYDKNIDASLSDWCILEKSIPSVTVEIANVAYPAPSSELIPAFNETLYIIPAFAAK